MREGGQKPRQEAEKVRRPGGAGAGHYDAELQHQVCYDSQVSGERGQCVFFSVFEGGLDSPCGNTGYLAESKKVVRLCGEQQSRVQSKYDRYGEIGNHNIFSI